MLTEPSISTTEQVKKQERLDVNGMNFVSIKDELYREYVFADGSVYEIKQPKWLFVRPSKAHLVIDDAGVTHYVQPNFIALRWNNAGEIRANF